MAPTNEEVIKQNVMEQLVWDDSVDANNIEADAVPGGTVMLEGVVTSYAEKKSAGEDVCEVPGVKNVKNNLQVIFPDSETRSGDYEITQRISKSLLWNSKIDSTHIHVETINRIVTLKGTVLTYWEKCAAEELANRTSGVAEVVNLLRVQLKETVVDRDIENDIKQAFKRNILIDKNKIRVESEKGNVRLSGSVENYFVKRDAIDIANHTTGVVDVIDEIMVENH